MAGLDPNTKLLLHCDGADTSTSFPDVSPTPHTVTAQGSAQVDTAFKKWGTGSVLLDGDSDYLTVPDSADWDIFASNTAGAGNGDWTVDFQARLGSLVSDPRLINVYQDVSNYWYLFYNTGGSDLALNVYISGNNLMTGGAGVILVDTWYHIALVIAATGTTKNMGLYINGTQVSFLAYAGVPNLTSALWIGANKYGDVAGNWVNGHMDEIRIQNSNYFGITPDAGLTTSFTPPTGPYSAAGGRAFQPIIF